MTPEERLQKIYAEINARAAQMAREQEESRRLPLAAGPPPSKGSQLLAIAMLISIFGSPLILLGVLFILHRVLEKDERRGLPHRELVEYIEVEGECAEDHVKESAPYTGHIEHLRNVTTDYHFASGYVTRRRSYTHEALMGRRSNPYRYEPSFAIGFANLRPEDLQGEVLRLAGLSEFLADEESGRPSYRATCTLRVTRRLDHRPSRQEEPAQYGSP
jgi:hypothetical protein